MSGFTQAYTDSILRALFQPVPKIGQDPIVLEYASSDKPAWPEYTESIAPLPTPPIEINADETLQNALDLSVSLGLIPKSPSFSEDIEAGLRESQYADTLSPSSGSASYYGDSPLLRMDTSDSDWEQRHRLRPQDLFLPDDFGQQGEEPMTPQSPSSFRFPDYLSSPVDYRPFSAFSSNADSQYRAEPSRTPEDPFFTLEHVNGYFVESSGKSRAVSTTSEYMEPLGLGIYMSRTRSPSPTRQPMTRMPVCPPEHPTKTTTFTISSPVFRTRISSGSPQTPNTMNIMNEQDPAFLRSLKAMRATNMLGDASSYGLNGSELRGQNSMADITRAASVMESEKARANAGGERSEGGKKRYLKFIDRLRGRESGE